MPRPRTDIRPRVLFAARQRFLVDGVDGASLRAIAREAGTSIGMIYYYFPSKDDLYLGVVEETYAALVADLEQVVETHEDFDTRVRHIYLRLAAGSRVESDTVRLILREAVISSERFSRLLERFKQGHIALVLRLVADGRREGKLAHDVPLPIAAIAVGALGVVPQAILQAFGHSTPEGAAAMVGSLVRVLLGGIGSVKP
jgi:AcrR family transcriptional regulator